LELAVTAATVAKIGINGWRARGTLQATVDLSLLALFLFVLAYTVSVQMTPGSRHTTPVILFTAAPLAGLCATVVTLFGDVADPAFWRLSLACWAAGLGCTLVTGALTWLLLRRGYWTQAPVQGAAIGFLASLSGVAMLELHCPYLDRLHIVASHLGVALTAAVAGALIGLWSARIEQ
jgi:hypothetical protein